MRRLKPRRRQPTEPVVVADKSSPSATVISLPPPPMPLPPPLHSHPPLPPTPSDIRQQQGIVILNDKNQNNIKSTAVETTELVQIPMRTKKIRPWSGSTAVFVIKKTKPSSEM